MTICDGQPSSSGTLLRRAGIPESEKKTRQQELEEELDGDPELERLAIRTTKSSFAGSHSDTINISAKGSSAEKGEGLRDALTQFDGAICRSGVKITAEALADALRDTGEVRGKRHVGWLFSLLITGRTGNDESIYPTE